MRDTESYKSSHYYINKNKWEIKQRVVLKGKSPNGKDDKSNDPKCVGDAMSFCECVSKST